MLKYRSHPAIAHIAPLAVFMLLTSLVPLIAVKNSELPWWHSAPEHWVYPLQTLVCGVLLLFFWKNYTFKPARGFVLATVLGLVGIVLWCLPAWIYQTMSADGQPPAKWLEWLGVVAREEGFNPQRWEHCTGCYAFVIGARFLRMVIIVPLVEEIFWRGFLMRYLVAGDDKPFTSVQVGTHSWKAFVITTACVVLVHSPEDYLGALVFGSLMYFLCVRTKSLAACVWMHAVANLLLGIYVMKTKQWGFW
jgi:uncharacterized protein